MAEPPLVRAALLCERVLYETDGAMSAIRILHEGYLPGPGERPIQVALLVMLVRGDAPPGPHRGRLEIRAPGGGVLSACEVGFELGDGGREQATSLVVEVAFAPTAPGVHWFRVGWGDPPVLLTEVPYTAHPAPARPGAAGSPA